MADVHLDSGKGKRVAMTKNHETRRNYILLGLIEMAQGFARVVSLGFWNPSWTGWFLFTYLED